MKKSYNKSIVGLTILGILVSPSLALAANTKNNQKAKGQNNFCAKIDSTATRLNDQLTKQTSIYNSKRADHFGKLADKRKVHDENVGAKRLSNDAKQDKKIDVLIKKANTDAKKAAVKKFNSDIDTAVSKRQAAVDNAVKTYRTGVDTAMNGRTGAVNNDLTELKKSVDAAIQTAKTSCANGTDSKIVKDTMQKNIKSAHDKFRSLKTDAQIKAQLKTLVDTRNASIKAAQDQFKVEVEKAKTDLKTAFSVK